MKVYHSQHEGIDVPNLDILSLLFDSDSCLAQETTNIHVDAADPTNAVSKAGARTLCKQVAHVLRHYFGIGSSGHGTDVVLTVITGSPFAPVLFYGIVAAGGVFCGASVEYQITELTRQIKDSRASVLVCSPECENRVSTAAAACNIARDRVLVLDSSNPRRWRLISAQDGSDLLSTSGGTMLDWRRITNPAELAQTTTCLLYSSGTTGLPKGVRVSHLGLVANNTCTMHVARRYQARRRAFAFDTIAHLPMANIAGITLYSTNPFYMGGTTYWMQKYDFDEFLACHRRYRPAYQFTVPPVWLRIAKSDQVTDHFDGLQVAVTGSAPIGKATLDELSKKLGRGMADLAQTWGTTETSGVITATDWPAYKRDGSWSVGELCPNVTLRVVDEAGQDVAEGEPGELLVGGPIVAQGYHLNAQATQDSFVNGFYHTGDIGIYRHGHVQIVDRKKELIKYKGAQVAPAELESLLTSHPLIADAAVIGVWNQDHQTEVPQACVVRRVQTERPPLTATAVVDFVKGFVAGYKQLRGGVEFVDAIPKSASGKILRKELRQKVSPQRRPKL